MLDSTVDKKGRKYENFSLLEFVNRCFTELYPAQSLKQQLVLLL